MGSRGTAAENPGKRRKRRLQYESKYDTYNLQTNTHQQRDSRGTWCTVMDQVKIRVWILDSNAVTLHPKTLDCPSAISLITALRLLCLESPSERKQEV